MPDQTGVAHTPSTMSKRDAQRLFTELADAWRTGRNPVSSKAIEMAMHPAYQRIIGMGPVAIPFILRELEREPDHWFWALRAISGEDPIPPESRGKIDQMTAAWLRWGRQNGYHLPDAA